MDINNNEIQKVFNSLDFSEIQEFMDDPDITDIDWDGRVLQVTNLEYGIINIKNKKLSKDFVDKITEKLGNAMGHNLNDDEQTLDAETEKLRITATNESITKKGKSISIRSSPQERKISKEGMLEYCPLEVSNFIRNAIESKCNVSVGGLPKHGKSEYVKSISAFISEYEKTLVVEDSNDLHYSDINPGCLCTEIRVNDRFSQADAIKFGLKHNISVVVLGEAKGEEVNNILDVASSGLQVIYTIHTTSARTIPKRMKRISNVTDIENFYDDVYEYIDIGIFVEKKERPGKKIERYISEVVVFFKDETDNSNKFFSIYEKGKNINYKELIKNMPDKIKRKFEKADIYDFFSTNEREGENESFKAV